MDCSIVNITETFMNIYHSFIENFTTATLKGLRKAKIVNVKLADSDHTAHFKENREKSVKFHCATL